jgi:hypothetical protein
VKKAEDAHRHGLVAVEILEHRVSPGTLKVFGHMGRSYELEVQCSTVSAVSLSKEPSLRNSRR